MKYKHSVAGGALAALVLAVLSPMSPAMTITSAEAEYDPHDWPMFNRDASGSRYNSAEEILSPDNVEALVEKWRVDADSVHATPIVVEGVVYVGDGSAETFSGSFRAIDAETGDVLWHETEGFGPITASALVVGDVVIFGDALGFMHGLDRETGDPVWPAFQPDSTPFTAIYGSPIPVGDKVVIGVSTNEDNNNPGHVCCDTRGSVVSFDPETGDVDWQTFTITDTELAAGSSGATVWASPTYDAQTGIVYVATGNNFTAPATGTSDAVIALDAETGDIIWVNQVKENDIFEGSMPYEPGLNLDFADSPQIFTLTNHTKVVAAGTKGGVMYVFNAATGALVNSRQVEPSSPFGGLFADTAQANGVTFINGTNHPDFPVGSGSGDLIALRTSRPGGPLKELWRVPTANSKNLGGVAVANGVVYFHSSSAGILYAVNSWTGDVLAELDAGAGISGPSVSNGQVFVGTGDIVSAVGGDPDGAIIAYGLP